MHSQVIYEGGQYNISVFEVNAYFSSIFIPQSEETRESVSAEPRKGRVCL